MNNNPPIYYDYNNVMNNIESPSTLHATKSVLSFYHKKYLIEKAMSIFEFDGIPETWDKNYFMYCLFLLGNVVVFNTERYGICCQFGMPYGYNIYYNPAKFVVTNPILGSLELKNGEDCEVIRLQPNYSGILDIINYFGDLMAICSESIAVNLFNTQLSYVFCAKNKTIAESFKKMFDRVHSGEVAVAVGKDLFTDDGTPLWGAFEQNINSVYIGDRILEDMRKIEREFNTVIGIPNSGSEKNERLLVDEVISNNVETFAVSNVWFDSIKDCLEKVNKMFNINISVNRRYDLRWSKYAESNNERFGLNESRPDDIRYTEN